MPNIYVCRNPYNRVVSMFCNKYCGGKGNILSKNKEFKLSDVSQEMFNKIQMSKSALPDCFGSPNKSWTACYGVDENDKYKYEGEYGGYEKVSEGLFVENLLIKK